MMAADMPNDPTVEVNPIDSVIERAIEVIGDKEQAMRWLGTPVQALGHATPISRLSTPKGQEEVRTILGRLEYGIW
jgi:putative toxin-antitoxin system antitoxin component (TIGR02293 family)